MRLKFPHIPRIISAGFVWGAVLTLIGTNAYAGVNEPLAYADALHTMFGHPYSARAHQQFGKELSVLGDHTGAQNELRIAGDLSNVLGAQTAETEKRDKTLLRHWQDTASNYPDYPDAYIQLAALSYKQGNLTDARSYLARAHGLNPNSQLVNDLLRFISP